MHGLKGIHSLNHSHANSEAERAAHLRERTEYSKGAAHALRAAIDLLRRIGQPDGPALISDVVYQLGNLEAFHLKHVGSA